MDGGVADKKGFHVAREVALGGALMATGLVALAGLAATARAQVVKVTPTVVKPQVVTPKAVGAPLAPAPSAQPASAPSPQPDPGPASQPGAQLGSGSVPGSIASIEPGPEEPGQGPVPVPNRHDADRVPLNDPPYPGGTQPVPWAPACLRDCQEQWLDYMGQSWDQLQHEILLNGRVPTTRDEANIRDLTEAMHAIEEEVKRLDQEALRDAIDAITGVGPFVPDSPDSFVPDPQDPLSTDPLDSGFGDGSGYQGPGSNDGVDFGSGDFSLNDTGDLGSDQYSDLGDGSAGDWGLDSGGFFGEDSGGRGGLVDLEALYAMD